MDSLCRARLRFDSGDVAIHVTLPAVAGALWLYYTQVCDCRRVGLVAHINRDTAFSQTVCINRQS